MATHLARQGASVGLETVPRLMRTLGLGGATRTVLERVEVPLMLSR
jgi:hypothetical protein